MAGGNRTVILRLPDELVFVIDNFYQKDRYLASRQAAIRELLETHPRVAEYVSMLYDDGKGKGHETGV